jgi:thiol-disulfide isomerase/thioredoxin
LPEPVSFLYLLEARQKMDLGFDNKNQLMGQAMGQAILNSTKAQEEAIVDQMKKYDDLLNAGDDELEALRQKRLGQMKAAAKQREDWRSNEHGTYTELGEGQHGADVAKQFFESAKTSNRLVVHFYRPTTRYCDIYHRHLQKLAEKHLETKFVKINVENTESPGISYLVKKLGIVVMPTLLIVKDRQSVHQIRGFDELGGSDSFETNTLAFVLGVHGGLTPTEEESEPPEDITMAGRGVNNIQLDFE